MNILLLIDSLRFGGAERQFVELIKGISKEQWLCPHIVYFEKSISGYRNELVKLSLPITHLQRKGKYDLKLFQKLNRYVKDYNIQLLHSFSVFSGLISVLYARSSGLPVIASTIRNSKDYNLKYYLSIRVQSVLSDRFISNSHSGFANRFKKFRKNFQVIYNGVNTDRFKISKAEKMSAKRRYHTDKYDYIISMIASLTKRRDHDTLLEAFRIILDEKPNTLLMIVGDGPERERLENKAKSFRIERNVCFTGYLNSINGVLSVTDVAVLVTHYLNAIEGIPNCLIESMAMGVPVVASRGGGTNEVITDSYNGILFDSKNVKELADGILKLLNNDAIRNNFGKTGKKTVINKFGYQRYIDEYLMIYRELFPYEG